MAEGPARASPDAGDWLVGAVQVDNPASVELDGKSWVFGGHPLSVYTGVTNVVQVYDPVRDKWNITRYPLPTRRFTASAAVVDGVAFIAGGSTGTSIIKGTDALFVLPSIP